MKDISITWNGDRPDLTINGVHWICRPQEEEPTQAAWHFPVGEGEYPPEKWYCAQGHGPQHTGLDLNLDVSPWGDVERVLGLSVYALTDGYLTYSTLDWSGVGMVVIRHEHEGAPLWVRYAHVLCYLPPDWKVTAGEDLGAFADWSAGDHLHIDMALDPFTREWLDPNIRWRNPVPILKAHLDPAIVDAMLRRG